MSKNSALRQLQFSVQCTEKEYKEAFRITVLKTSALRFWPLVMLWTLALVLLDLYCVTYGFVEILDPLSLILLFLAVLVPVYFFIYGWRYLSIRFRHYWHLYRHVGKNMLISGYSRGLVITTDAFRSQILFVDIRVMVEKREYLLLILDRRSFYILPKRDIPEEMREEFLEFVRHGMKRGAQNRRQFF